MSSKGINQEFKITTTGSDLHVREALGLLRAGLILRGVSDEVCSSSEIAMAEALNNIAEHAYAARDPGPVEIAVKISDAGVRFVLRDWGHPMPGNQLPGGTLPDNDVDLDDLPEGGFGWYMLHSLTESLSYSRQNDENQLVLVVSTPAQAS